MRGRILIADDDAAIVGLLERILARAGFTDVASTTDSSRVLDLFAEFSPDLLLLDLTMPEPDGMEIMARLSKQYEFADLVPILVLTGDLSAERKQRALAGGASDFLTKPFDVPEVVQRIRNLLERRFLHLELQRHNRILETRVRERTRSLEEARLDVLSRLARAAEFRDDETGEHIRRVGRMSAALADRLGVAPDIVRTVELTAPLHDVGKIGVPDAILLKPGKLTPSELVEMQSHTTIGAALLSDSPWHLLETARDIALHHHEAWDGTGYPHGLAGEEIPLVARFVSVADVFDALAHDRTYRRAWSRGRVLSHLQQERGTRFDPAVVDAMLAICEEYRDPHTYPLPSSELSPAASHDVGSP